MADEDGTVRVGVGVAATCVAVGSGVALAVGRGVDVAVGGGIGVAVGGIGVAVGGMGVAVGGIGVAVGGTGVAVGGIGVTVAGIRVLVGDAGVDVRDGGVPPAREPSPGAPGAVDPVAPGDGDPRRGAPFRAPRGPGTGRARSGVTLAPLMGLGLGLPAGPRVGVDAVMVGAAPCDTAMLGGGVAELVESAVPVALAAGTTTTIVPDGTVAVGSFQAGPQAVVSSTTATAGSTRCPDETARRVARSTTPILYPADERRHRCSPERALVRRSRQSFACCTAPRPGLRTPRAVNAAPANGGGNVNRVGAPGVHCRSQENGR